MDKPLVSSIIAISGLSALAYWYLASEDPRKCKRELKQSLESKKIEFEWLLNGHYAYNEGFLLKSLCDADEMYNNFFSILINPENIPASLMPKLFPWRIESAKILLKYFTSYLNTRNFEIPVKIILSHGTTSKKMLEGIEKTLKPIVGNKLGKFSAYGCTHAGVQVGPWYIDWDFTELAIPWPISSKFWTKGRRVILVLDVDTIKLTEHSLKKLSDLITSYNKDVLFNQYNFNPQQAGTSGSNCACFVEAVLTALGVNLMKIQNTAIDELLEQVRKNPNEDLTMRYKNMTFSNSEEGHKELVDYYIKESSKLPKNDFFVLKAFDRRMHFNGVEDNESCPFGCSRTESTSCSNLGDHYDKHRIFEETIELWGQKESVQK